MTNPYRGFGLIGLLITLAVIVFAGGVAYFSFLKSSHPTDSDVSQADSNSIAAELNMNKSITASNSSSTKIQVRWENPKALQNLDLFIKDAYNSSGSEKYFKVGVVDGGSYDGCGVSIANIGRTDNIENYTTGFYFIDCNGIFTVVPTPSENFANEIDEQLINGNKLRIDSSSKFPDLDFPKEIKHNNSTFHLVGKTLTPSFDEDKKNWRLIFTSHDSTGVNDFYTNTQKNAFYTRGPDGTIFVYSLKIDFSNDGALFEGLSGSYFIPNISWNSGAINTEVYNGYLGYGIPHSDLCNTGRIATSTILVTQNDLTATGKTINGDQIYELRNINHPILRETYNIYVDNLNQYKSLLSEEKEYSDNTYKRITIASYDTFIVAHPIFFWIDPFGDLAEFINKDFLPLDVCEKGNLLLSFLSSTAPSAIAYG